MSLPRSGPRHPLLFLLAIALPAAALSPSPASSSELRLGYSAIGKLMEEGLFTDGGRHYLQGSRDSSCAYSYVEQPSVNAVAGRLYIRMKLSMRLGLEVAGNCIGTSDTFFTTLSGVPTYADGALELREVEVETEDRSYGEVVGPLLVEAIGGAFRYPLRERIAQSVKSVMEQTGLELTVRELEIPEIRLERRALVVPVELTLVLR